MTIRVARAEITVVYDDEGMTAQRAMQEESTVGEGAKAFKVIEDEVVTDLERVPVGWRRAIPWGSKRDLSVTRELRGSSALKSQGTASPEPENLKGEEPRGVEASSPLGKLLSYLSNMRNHQAASMRDSLMYCLAHPEKKYRLKADATRDELVQHLWRDSNADAFCSPPYGRNFGEQIAAILKYTTDVEDMAAFDDRRASDLQLRLKDEMRRQEVQV